MKDKLKGVLIAIAAVAVLAVGDTAIAGATGGRDDNATDKAITGQALDRAKAVALDQVGGGKVTGTEAGDEEGAYEVEVTRADGSQVDVHLDKGFNVINQHGDSDRGGEHGQNESGDQD
jgi:uncharacterized membrane protein YkoI